MEEMDEDQADAVEKVFDLDYNVAQEFCSNILPKAVLLFTGEDLNDGMDFEPEDGEGDDENEGRAKREEKTGLPFPASEKTTSE